MAAFNSQLFVSDSIIFNNGSAPRPAASCGGEAKRAFDAMMGMKKIDVAAIKAARPG